MEHGRRPQCVSDPTRTSGLTLTLVRRFHSFFHQLDHYNTSFFLWATAGGWDVAQNRLLQELKHVKAPQEGVEDGDENGDEEG